MRRCSAPILAILLFSALAGCAPSLDGADNDICNEYSTWLGADTANPAERAQLVTALNQLFPGAVDATIANETRALIDLGEADETEFRTQGQRLTDACTELGWEPIEG